MQALARNRARFLLEAGAGELAACELVWWKRTAPEDRRVASMRPRLSDGRIEQWVGEVAFSEEAHYIKYGFRLTDRSGERAWLDALGLHDAPGDTGSFELLQLNETDLLRLPDWSAGCAYYQIFPERFARSGAPAEYAQPWDAAPTRDNYLGGNLRGVIGRLPYLAELGVDCLYLTPVFEGDFNHKYATTDYFRIDPMFGTEADLVELVDQAHGLGLRVVLDGVFNHCGVRFAPFADLLKRGRASRYRDWFYPKRFPVEIDAACYECVGDYPYMPRLNGANPEVRAYVRDVLLYWLDRAGIDGWRFDVADELDRHAVVGWREAVKRRYPDALMLAETWTDASRLLGPDGFDCAMNYLFRDAAVDFFARDAISAEQLRDRLANMLMRYPRECDLAMYNCLGSHDTARFLTEAGGEQWRLRLAMAFQALFPGAPAIYYGDELGMAGENDPGCRGGMAWERPDAALLEWQHGLLALRRRHPALRRGGYEALVAEGRVFGFARALDGDQVAAFFNAGDEPAQTDFAETGETVHIPPRSVKIIE